MCPSAAESRKASSSPSVCPPCETCNWPSDRLRPLCSWGSGRLLVLLPDRLCLLWLRLFFLVTLCLEPARAKVLSSFSPLLTWDPLGIVEHIEALLDCRNSITWSPSKTRDSMWSSWGTSSGLKVKLREGALPKVPGFSPASAAAACLSCSLSTLNQYLSLLLTLSA